MQEIIAYKHTNDCVERSVYFMTKSNKLRSYNVTDFLARKHLLHDVGLINLLSSVLQETKQICNTYMDPIKTRHLKWITGSNEEQSRNKWNMNPNESFVGITLAIIHEFNMKKLANNLTQINSCSRIHAHSHKPFITGLDTLCTCQRCVVFLICWQFAHSLSPKFNLITPWSLWWPG